MTHVENILSVYRAATPAQRITGMYWYAEANRIAHEISPDNPAIGAGVIAALSPRLRWEKNVDYARLAFNLLGYDVDPVLLSYIPALGNSRAKAMAMVNGADPIEVLGKGPKTNAFFDNILNPFTSMRVTVDKHAFCIAKGEWQGYKDHVVTNKEYVQIEADYVVAAQESGDELLPMQLQAITWCTWRDLHPTW